MEQPKTFKSALPFGVYLGIGLILFSVLMYIMGQMQNRTIGILMYLLYIVFIIVGIKDYRDKKSGGFISYGKAFTTGFYISIIGGTIAGLYTFLFFQFFDPEALKPFMAAAEEQMLERNPNLTDEQVDQGMKIAGAFMTPPMMAVWSIVYSAIFGAILSLIIAIFMKKEGTPFDMPTEEPKPGE